MKLLLALLVVGVPVVGMQLAKNDLFHGTWKMDGAKSTSMRQLPREQLMVFDTTNNKEQMIDDITTADGKTVKVGYSVPYNSNVWHPAVLEKSDKPTSSIMVIRVDPHTEVRIQRSPEGKFAFLALRLISQDGKQMKTAQMGSEGTLVETMILDKQ